MKKLILGTNTRSLKAVLSGAVTTNQPDFVVSYVDKSASALSEESNPGSFNDTTDVILLSAPASGHTKTVLAVNINNRDTVAVTITFKLVDSSGPTTTYLGTFILQPGDVLTVDGIIDNNGRLKTALASVPTTSLTGTLQAAQFPALTGDINTSAGSLATTYAGLVPTSKGGMHQDWSASSGIPKLASGTASLVTAPTGTIVGHDDSQTISNKTFAGTSPFTGLVDMNTGTLRLPVNSSALTATEGHAGWENARRLMRVYDSQRERAISMNGWAPYAYPLGYVENTALSTSFNMNAQWYTILVPMFVPSHLLLQSASVWNIDTASARTWGWDLYEQTLNNGNSGEKTLNRIAASTTDETFTAAAASMRTINAGSAPIYLAPGIYWLAIQNRHASNAFQAGAYTVTFTGSNLRFKTTSGSNGSTLDASTSWSSITSMIGVRLNGRVFGETSAF